ncbi:lactate utilization protein C [Kitasatospora sp. NPDC057223]|uniref:LutC/YkgG family protein n=1 Tax=Kitasatospora sp. NPDC057223 TaxID=3346055 RepID=UPI00362D1DDF
MTTPSATSPTSRERILQSIRDALAGAGEAAPVDRGYAEAHVPDDPAALLALLADNLQDYRARVHRAGTRELPGLIARLLADRDVRTLVLPPGVPEFWTTATDVDLLVDDPEDLLTTCRLDAVEAVLTGCTLAIAETGTIVLDGGPGQGRRVLTLVPDHHICVVRAPEQIVASLPLAMHRLDPTRPLTWISGPSATSDIELERVEGVHGPRTLDIILPA